jgi:opacity protein-like surface antigen
MKKLIFSSALCAAFVCAWTASFAAGPNSNPNQSAEYVKTQSRSASVEPDAAFFNPAGTALMQDGFYYYLSEQVIVDPIRIKPFGGYANELMMASRHEYKADKSGFTFINLYLVHKKGRFAWSFGFLPLGGGGNATYNNGLQMIDLALNPQLNPPALLSSILNQLYGGAPVIGGTPISKLKGFSVVYTVQTSLAYEVIKDLLTVSLGVRGMYGVTVLDATLYGLGGRYGGYIPGASNFHANQQGFAYGFIGGVDVKPVKDLTIAVKGEWNSPLRQHTVSTDYIAFGMFDKSNMDGNTRYAQIPGTLGVGASYKIMGAQIAAHYTYYFNQFAQMRGREKNFTGGYDVGGGIDYTITAVPINIGAGYQWSATGARPSALSQFNDDVNYHTVGAGISYLFDGKMKLTLAFAYSHYITTDINKGTMFRFNPAKYYREGYFGAIGFTHKVL